VFIPGLLKDMNQLEELGKRHGVSIQSLFIATYGKLYAPLTSTPEGHDVVIGIYLANRSHTDLDIAHSVIPTVNLVPLRIVNAMKKNMLEVAQDIQKDIQTISSPTSSSVSLFEIAEWTGIKIDTFVNFLNLPDTVVQRRGNVTITPVGEWDGDVRRVTEASSRAFADEGAMGSINERATSAYLVSLGFFGKKNSLLTLCQHAVDVEATIHDGALDVGVFAPTEMLGLQDAEDLVRNVKLELEGLVKGVE
jgi:hypothetical protein